jgi:peptide/nickel transport system ATP-binding protein
MNNFLFFQPISTREVEGLNDNLLEITNLKTYFYSGKREVKAVDGIDLSIRKGETVAVVGESGSGKSVTSLSIMGLIPMPPGKIVDGTILFDGQDITHLNTAQMNKIRGRKMSMIFQEPMTSLNPVYTIGNQIIEPLMIHNRINKNAAMERAVELLDMVGFARSKQIVNEYPHQLSGGMRQRAMIAMAMSNNPNLLIADEPTTALDVTIQAQIIDLMQDVKEKMNTAILLITHDLGVVADMADRVMVMYAGQIVEEADVRSVFKNPKHPYTLGLLGSIPKIEEDAERLESIPGTIPPAHAFPKGCRFAARCKYAKPECVEHVPALVEVAPGHKARCILYS